MDTDRKRELVDRLSRRQQNLCYWCEKPFTADNPATLEHIIRRAAIRTGVPKPRNNLAAAHAKCNNERHGRT